jgi:hypothetical protein
VPVPRDEFVTDRKWEARMARMTALVFAALAASRPGLAPAGPDFVKMNEVSTLAPNSDPRSST